MRRDLFMHDVGRAVFLHQSPSSSRFCKTPSGDNPAGEMPQKWHLTIAIDYPAEKFNHKLFQAVGAGSALLKLPYD